MKTAAEDGFGPSDWIVVACMWPVAVMSIVLTAPVLAVYLAHDFWTSIEREYRA